MFEQIKKVVDFMKKDHPKGYLPYQIETIKNAIIAMTKIDRIDIYDFPSEDNPIIGYYRRYDNQSMGAYAEIVNRAEVYFRADLNTCWKRFVTCKEMCHALVEDSKSMRSGSIEQVGTLIDMLRLPDTSRDSFSVCPQFKSEKMAEIAAVELLCPIEDRKNVLEQRQKRDISDAKIAMDFRVPVELVTKSFNKKYINLVEKMFEIERNSKM